MTEGGRLRAREFSQNLRPILEGNLPRDLFTTTLKVGCSNAKKQINDPTRWVPWLLFFLKHSTVQKIRKREQRYRQSKISGRQNSRCTFGKCWHRQEKRVQHLYRETSTGISNIS